MKYYFHPQAEAEFYDASRDLSLT